MGLREEIEEYTQTENTPEVYHPYEYQENGNDSWAGALPVKQ